MSELARTYLSAAAAGALAFAMIAGIAWFLGFPAGTAVTSGFVAAVLGTVLLLGAAKRSGHLDDTTATTHEDDRA